MKTQVAAIGKAFDARAAGAADGRRFGDHRPGRQVPHRRQDAARRHQRRRTRTARRSKASRCVAPPRRCSSRRLQYEATFDDQLKSDFDAAAADYNAAFAAANLADDVKATLNLDVNNFVDAFKEASAAELAYAQATDALVKAFDPLAAPIKDLGDAVAAAGAADGGLAAAQADDRDDDRPRRRDRRSPSA